MGRALRPPRHSSDLAAQQQALVARHLYRVAGLAVVRRADVDRLAGAGVDDQQAVAVRVGL